MTGLIDIYALLPENVSFFECFKRSRIYFTKYCNNPTDITWNRFCGVFLKNQKYSQRRHGKDIFFEIYSRRLKDVTQKTSFLRCFWDVLRASQKSHLFWDVSKGCLRCLSQWRSDWDLSETSHAGWESFLRYLLAWMFYLTNSFSDIRPPCFYRELGGMKSVKMFV